MLEKPPSSKKYQTVLDYDEVSQGFSVTRYLIEIWSYPSAPKTKKTTVFSRKIATRQAAENFFNLIKDLPLSETINN